MAAAGFPNWGGLIQSGIEFVSRNGGATEVEILAARETLESGQLIEAAQALKKLLRAPSGQYAAWLESEFLEMPSPLLTPQLIDRISDLLCPVICTTNYDMLLEKHLVSHHENITWRHPAAMLRALQHGGAVFHLHGIYTEPQSVVLGRDNYEEIVKEEAYRSILQTLWLDRTLLFIGCSFSGLEDPDFLRMLTWFSTTFPGAAHRHFALMLEGSCTKEEEIRWLHEYRIQVVPYGPSHEDLADSIRQLTPNATDARAVRIRRIRELVEGGDIKDTDNLVSLLRSAGASASRADLSSTAQILFQTTKRAREDIRQNFIGMQLLTRTMITPEEITKQHEIWRKGEARYEGEFRAVVQRAADALFLFPPSLLTALYQRDVGVHYAVLEGMCRSEYRFAEMMLSRFAKHNDDRYFLENMARILRSVEAILEADPEKTFPSMREAPVTSELPKKALLVGRSRSIEIRQADLPESVIASLPMDEDISSACFSSMDGIDLVLVETSAGISAWDPSLSSPHKTYTVDSKWGIQSACHLQEGGTLVSLIAIHDGPVFVLNDLCESACWRPLSNSDHFTSMALLPGLRAFGIPNLSLPILELFPDHAEVSLSAAELVEQISQLPILSAHWKKRIESESREWAELSADTQFGLRFQHLKLTAVRCGAEHLLALRVQLRFSHACDTVIFLLKPQGEKLLIVGHCLMEDRLMVGFDVITGATGELLALCPLLSTGTHDYDLAVWSREARTSEGLIFVREGSALKSDHDLICARFGTRNTGYVTDDTGGLFEIDLAGKSCREVARDSASYICSLDFREIR